MTQPANQVAAEPWHDQIVNRCRRWFADPGTAPDSFDLAIVIFCFGAFTQPVLFGAHPGHGSTVGVATIGVIAAVPRLVRRRLPLVVLTVVAAVVMLASLTGVGFTPFVGNAGPVVGIAMLTVADRLPRRTALIAGALVLIAMSVAMRIAYSVDLGTDQDAVQLIVGIPGWLIGDAMRRPSLSSTTASSRIRPAIRVPDWG
ncbi:MAG: DUF7134 domain-containing protein [Nakamurella sp.]